MWERIIIATIEAAARVLLGEAEARRESIANRRRAAASAHSAAQKAAGVGR